LFLFDKLCLFVELGRRQILSDRLDVGASGARNHFVCCLDLYRAVKLRPLIINNGLGFFPDSLL
jgi:hypothetical protein